MIKPTHLLSNKMTIRAQKFFAELKSLLSSISDLIYPPKCPSCDSKPLNRKIPFCFDCLCQITPISGNFRGFSTLEGYNSLNLGKALFLGFHEGPLQKAILSLKQKNNIDLGRFMAYTLAHIMPESFLEADVITCVPSSKESMKMRGFNPSEILANELSITSGIPLMKDLIIKVRHTEKQALLPYCQRIQNVTGAYQTTRNLKDTKIILVDDVLTTGSTAMVCSNEIIKAGGKIIGTAFYSYRPLFCT
jgi:competence protein ComFC